MKRFMKGCGISALVLITVGVTLGMAGRSVAGQTTMREVVETVTGGRIRMDGGNWWGWNIVANNYGIYDYGTALSAVYEIASVEQQEATMIIDECIMEGNGPYAYRDWEYEVDELPEIEDVVHFDDDYKILKGDVAEYQLGTDINGLDIEMAGGSVITVISGDDNFYLAAQDVRKFQGFVEDKTLYIKTGNLVNGKDNKNGQVILYVPENYYFHEVEVEVGSGDLWFDNLNAQKVSLEVGAGYVALENPQIQELEISLGAGEIEMTGMEIGDLDVEVGMGRLMADGAVLNYADVECAMGYVEIGLAGSEKDYNYHLVSSMGDIQVGEICYISGGNAQKRTIHNNASKEIEIECAMGNVNIWFWE